MIPREDRVMYAVKVTRKDGSTFLVYGAGGPSAIYYTREEAVAWKRELVQHIALNQMKIVKVRVQITEL